MEAFVSQQRRVHSLGTYALRDLEPPNPSPLTSLQMLEAMESFILVFGIDGGIVYVSEGVTSLAGHLPKDLVECSIYEIIKESNKQDLYRFLATPKLDNAERIFTLHIRRGDHKVRWDLNRDMSKTPEPLDELEEEEDQYQLVRLTGFFRKWDMTIDNSNDVRKRF